MVQLLTDFGPLVLIATQGSLSNFNLEGVMLVS